MGSTLLTLAVVVKAEDEGEVAVVEQVELNAVVEAIGSGA
jgi:hypothetical protein